MSVHIGNKIKQVAKAKKIKLTDLSKSISTSRNNLYNIFERKSIDTDLLLKVSRVLDHDFFQYYTPLKSEVEKLRDDVSLLKEMIELLKKDKSKKK